MPSTVLPSTPHYVAPPPTSSELNWADLAIIDFSQVHTPEGRARLAIQVRDALTTTGFFHIINHGYTPEQNARIFDIADIPFEQVGVDEKKEYAGRVKETGSYQGYKPRSYWNLGDGVKDQIENYNIHRDVTKRDHPKSLRPFLPEIASFNRFNHFNVLHPILQLVARGLELPENTFVDNHNFDAEGDTWVRFMKYYPRSEEDETKTKNVWLKGHTDFGSITILWSQPISALQIQFPDGTWRWVRHIENSLLVNSGDCLEALSGGFYKAVIHRVVQPPPDQRHCPRLGVFYFVTPDDGVKLLPHLESPVLQRVGVQYDRFGGLGREPMTADTWCKARASAYGQTQLKKGRKEGVEEEVLSGVVVKHYN